MNQMTNILLMMMMMMTCLHLPRLTHAGNKDDYYRLYNLLFENPENYIKDVRPAVNQTHPIKVRIHFYLTSLIDVDEKEQTLVTSGALHLIWEDTYLAWNKSDFGDIDLFLVPQSMIYLPDVIVSNSVREAAQLGYMEQRVRLSDQGFINWQPNVLLVTSCSIDITYFPFDTQICYITLTTAVSVRKEIDLRALPIDTAISLEDFTLNGQWELTGTNVRETILLGLDKTVVQYGILLKRRRVFYLLNIVLPVFFLSLTASLVFALPADEGEKMGTGITVLLSFAVYLTIVSDLVPNTSLQVSVLALYLTTLLGMCAISVVVCAFILRLHFRDEDVPVGPKTTRFTRFLQRLACSKKDTDARTNKISPSDRTRENTGIENKQDARLKTISDEDKDCLAKTQVEGGSLTWKQVAKTMDDFCFILFSVLSIIITLMCLLFLGVGGAIDAPELRESRVSV